MSIISRPIPSPAPPAPHRLSSLGVLDRISAGTTHEQRHDLRRRSTSKTDQPTEPLTYTTVGGVDRQRFSRGRLSADLLIAIPAFLGNHKSTNCSIILSWFPRETRNHAVRDNNRTVDGRRQREKEWDIQECEPGSLFTAADIGEQYSCRCAREKCRYPITMTHCVVPYTPPLPFVCP